MQKSAVAALLAALILSACSPAQRESGEGEPNTSTPNSEEPTFSNPAVPDDAQNIESADHTNASDVSDLSDEASAPDDADLPEQARTPDGAGAWVFKGNNGQTAAIYGYGDSDAAFSVNCDDLAEELVFYRAANAPANSVINLNLLTSEGNTLIRALSNDMDLPGYTGRLANTDPWLEKLAAADTLTVNLQGENEITVPVSPELKRVIASCK